MANSFAKNLENFKQQLFFNVIILFSNIACCLVAGSCSKKVFQVNQKRGGHKELLGGYAPPVAAALHIVQ